MNRAAIVTIEFVIFLYVSPVTLLVNFFVSETFTFTAPTTLPNGYNLALAR